MNDNWNDGKGSNSISMDGMSSDYRPSGTMITRQDYEDLKREVSYLKEIIQNMKQLVVIESEEEGDFMEEVEAICK